MDPLSDEYYKEIDKRMRIDFPHKFGTTEQRLRLNLHKSCFGNAKCKPRSQNCETHTITGTIAKKLGVPLEEYAKQLKITEGV